MAGSMPKYWNGNKAGRSVAWLDLARQGETGTSQTQQSKARMLTAIILTLPGLTNPGVAWLDMARQGKATQGFHFRRHQCFF